jgi:hypothetical protein
MATSNCCSGMAADAWNWKCSDTQCEGSKAPVGSPCLDQFAVARSVQWMVNCVQVVVNVLTVR